MADRRRSVRRAPLAYFAHTAFCASARYAQGEPQPSGSSDADSPQVHTPCRPQPMV